MAENTMTMATAGVDSAVLDYRRSPVQDLAAEMAAASGEQVTLREVPFLTQTGVRVQPGTPAGDALEAALGVPLPRRVGEVTDAAGETSVLWFAPDEFLVVGPDEAVSGIAATEVADRLAGALGDEPGQVVDLSANRTTLELSGPRARNVLDKSCHLDLHPREFPVGRAVLTLLDKVPIVLWRTGTDTWWVMPRASFATHVVRWLVDGMREFR